MALKKLVAGNWKMHGLSSDLGEIKAIGDASKAYPPVDVALCVPATLIERATRAVPGLAIGGQDAHFAEKGAHTGCISPAMLIDAGARHTIVGHSERREAQGETDAEVKAKAEAVLAAGLAVIICVGESDAVREEGKAVQTVSAQLDASLPASFPKGARFSIAYEPIWAIGTGKVPTVEEIGEMHAALRGRLVAAYGETGKQVRILYGGSVKASNAAEIFAVPDVDGALVGGASLKAADFLPIVEAAAAAKVGARSIPVEDLHRELCAALLEAGGIALDELLEPTADISVADVYYQDDGVIVEVKSLTTDRNKTPSVKAKAGMILSKHAAAGRISAPRGEIKVSLPDVHPAVAEDLLRNLGQRVSKELTKANAQIRASKKRLDDQEAVGLCIFITSAEFDVHSGVIVTAAERQLRGGKCSSINELMIIAVPEQLAPSTEPTGFISFHPRTNFRPVPQSLKRRIAEAWVSHAAYLTGTQPRIETAEASEFEDRFVSRIPNGGRG